jgi:hypothetical protein
MIMVYRADIKDDYGYSAEELEYMDEMDRADVETLSHLVWEPEGYLLTEEPLSAEEEEILAVTRGESGTVDSVDEDWYSQHLVS